jgi:hypothetical protein
MTAQHVPAEDDDVEDPLLAEESLERLLDETLEWLLLEWLE